MLRCSIQLAILQLSPPLSSIDVDFARARKRPGVFFVQCAFSASLSSAVGSSASSSPQSPHLYQSSPSISHGCSVRPAPFPHCRSVAAQYLSQPQQMRSGCFGCSGNRLAISDLPGKAVRRLILVGCRSISLIRDKSTRMTRPCGCRPAEGVQDPDPSAASLGRALVRDGCKSCATVVHDVREARLSGQSRLSQVSFITDQSINIT